MTARADVDNAARANGFMYRRYQDCPDAVKRHSEPPRNMNADGYSKTHVQERCPTCGFWSVWRRR